MLSEKNAYKNLENDRLIFFQNNSEKTRVMSRHLSHYIYVYIYICTYTCYSKRRIKIIISLIYK